MKIGLDCGGVLGPLASDTAEKDDLGLAPPFAGAVDGVKAIVKKHGQENVYVVSRAGWKMRKKTMAWMKRHGIVGEGAILEANVHYCFERAEKQQVCEKLGIEFMVDDRLEILHQLRGQVQHLIAFNQKPEYVAEYPDCRSWSILVDDWLDLTTYLNVL